MRRLILVVTTAIIAALIRLVSPVTRLLARIFYTSLLKAHVPGVDASVQCDGLVRALGTKAIRIGKRCRIGVGTEFETFRNGHVHLGDDIRINRGCTLVSYAAISIGKLTIIGEYVSIRDANHGMAMDTPMKFQEHEAAPISIGSDVWIGRGSCILPGVTIGDGVVIGANSVVTTDIPAYSIAAGTPARVIRKRDTLST